MKAISKPLADFQLTEKSLIDERRFGLIQDAVKFCITVGTGRSLVLQISFMFPLKLEQCGRWMDT